MSALLYVALGVVFVGVAILLAISNRPARIAIAAMVMLVGLAFAVLLAYGTGVLDGILRSVF